MSGNAEFNRRLWDIRHERSDARRARRIARTRGLEAHHMDYKFVDGTLKPKTRKGGRSFKAGQISLGGPEWSRPKAKA